MFDATSTGSDVEIVQMLQDRERRERRALEQFAQQRGSQQSQPQ